MSAEPERPPYRTVAAAIVPLPRAAESVTQPKEPRELTLCEWSGHDARRLSAEPWVACRRCGAEL